MKLITADDGRILTPPKESEPLLKDAFPAFYKLLGHIRFFYVADEIWDGKSSLVFKASGKQLDDIYRVLKKHATVNQCRPYDQLTIDLNGCPCGWRCDLCLGSKNCCEKNFTASENFGYMNWVCYHDCIPEKVERFDGVFKCPGCKAIRTNKGVWKDWEGCKAFICISTKGYVNCLECGEYHSSLSR
ncbi:MAG: hypothetical protein PHC69_01085 [Ruminiclostridium sp.]|nr:hypothetical protein [Ruminiclostridium sp.]